MSVLLTQIACSFQLSVILLPIILDNEQPILVDWVCVTLHTDVLYVPSVLAFGPMTSRSDLSTIGKALRPTLTIFAFYSSEFKSNPVRSLCTTPTLCTFIIFFHLFLFHLKARIVSPRRFPTTARPRSCSSIPVAIWQRRKPFISLQLGPVFPRPFMLTQFMSKKCRSKLFDVRPTTCFWK